jgi:predicted nucleic-acid-binding Zn-ribbon protein
MAIKDTHIPCVEGQQHHWIIDIANGPFSKGKCQRCEQEEMFENSLSINNSYEQQVIWRTRVESSHRTVL